MLKFSMIRQSFQMSVRNILANRMRSFLTMLGIIIGVSAVISLVTIVSLVTSSMMGEFSSMGAGSLTINAFGTPTKKGLTENDLSEIAALDNVRAISPSVSVRTNIVRDSTIYERITVTGRNELYFRTSGEAALGRMLSLSDMDGLVNVCVLDENANKVLFQGRNPIGRYIKLAGFQYKVVGVIKKDSNLAAEITDTSGNRGQVFIPYRNALKINNANAVSVVDVYVEDTSRMEETTRTLEKLLSAAFNNSQDSFYIVDMSSLVSAMDSVTGMMSGLLGGIASIALLVGGIGIMNMMLVSVTERTKEIGLRKALGAPPSVIQLQFLLESVILSVFGGVIGILIGELVSYVASLILKVDFRLNTGAILLGFFFSLAVGVIFGWAPARRASRLNPIDALRSE